MQKTLTVIAVAVTLSACSGVGTRTVVDSGGARSPEVALRYEDDLDTCLRIAHENAKITDIPKAWYNWFVRPASLYLLEEKEYNFKRVLKLCMTNRGHSVLDTEYHAPRW